VARKRGLAKREVYRRAQRETPPEGAE